MNKEIICIECPQGCVLSADIADGKLISASGNKCPKGLVYAQAEVENPQRIFTSTVLCLGLEFKMLPVRTNQPIPRAKVFEAGVEIKKIRVDRPVSVGEAVVKNFLNLGVDLIATRTNLKKGK
jgi:CxxC motif-containing protein